jgi:hypothetical protein
MIDQISLNQNFGLGYDNDGVVTGTAGTWYLITATNLAPATAAWSQQFAGDTSGGNLDASWFIQATTTDGTNYTVVSRSLDYYFGSVLQTRFFFFGDQKIYDSRTGTVISDFVNVLKTNSRPDSNLPLETDTRLKIIGQPVESDGYVDDFQVLVGFEDTDSDGVPDNPDFFTEIVGTAPTPSTANNPWVFLQETVDFDNLQRYLLVEPEVVNSQYASLDAIELVKEEYVPGQVFYAL